MLFNSFIFLFFLGVVLPVFYMLPKRSYKNLFLLVASYIFYGYWDWRFCSLLLISTIIDFYIGKAIYNSENKKTFLIISLASNLGILFTFKYFNFFIDNFKSIANFFNYNLDFLHLHFILPIGISFYTFQTLSYTIDIYREKIKPTTNFIDFALFVSFFPQLVAGPIERAKSLLPQLAKKLTPSKDQLKQGITLIIFGLFRKVMIGDTAGKIVDPIFNNLSEYKSIEIIIALILFSIQIYADFSGYSHIARGTAKLLGVELMKNFEQPYLSRNITEFWRTWHISLSSWLKDYLYIPLGGNRKGKLRTYINIFITMLLGGLWHGASWNFIIWGGLHGIYLTIHKSISNVNNQKRNYLKTVLSTLFTYVIVTITWLFFRASSFEQTKVAIAKIIHWESSEFSALFIKIGASYFVTVLILDLIEKKYGHTAILKVKANGIIIGTLLGLFFITLSYMFQANPSPFIYFQF